MIHTENLTRRFGNVLAVDGLSLDVREGEVFGFLGPNGAGKTTTVRMLTALIAPSSGSAVVNGFRVGRQDGDIRRSVGILTETPGLYDTLSAQRNLEIFARLYEVKDIWGQVEKYLRLFGLWERREDPAATFSKGMKQKLALARALLHEPKVVFLDEPTAALDPEAAHLVRESIVQLRQEGRTVFLCTHNLDEADRLCDRVGVFKTRLLAVDTPAHLRTQFFGRKVVFHLHTADLAMAQAVAAQPFVRSAQAVDNKLVVALDDPDAHNPDLVRLLVGLGADVQFVGELRHSLEDVYMELVKPSGQRAG
jgi:ABC-2 type transport system ATP-binding protein